MEFENVGNILKKIRKKRGLTQSKLADGICSRRYVSYIETGTVLPSLYYLIRFCKKLNINLSIFMDYLNYTNPVWVYGVKEKVDNLKSHYKYNQLHIYIKELKYNINFTNVESIQYIMWHEGIYEYVTQNYNAAIDLFKYCLNINDIKELKHKNHSYQELEIINSYSICLFEKGDIENSIELLIHINDYLHEDIPSAFKTYRLNVKVLYNLSKALNLIGKYKLSQEYIEKGISMCIKYNSMYYLGELYYQKATNYICLNQKGNAIDYFIKSYNILDIQNNSFLKDILLKKTKEKYNINIL